MMDVGGGGAGGLGGGMPGTWVRSRTKRAAETLIEERKRFSAVGGYQTWTRRQRRMFWLAAPGLLALLLVLQALD